MAVQNTNDIFKIDIFTELIKKLEEMSGTKYNDLIVLPWLALALLPLGLFMFKKRDSHTQLLFFFWVIITLFMAWYKLKFTFVFGLAIAPAAAIIAYLLFEGLKKFNLNKGIEAKTLMIIFFFIIATGVAASAVFFPDYVPYNNENPQWVAAENWIISSTPADAKLFNWWDQGHILAYMTDRKVSTDNRNLSEFANRSMAEFVTTYDANRGYTIASKEIGADYVVLDSTMFNSAPTFEYYMAGRIDGNVNKLIQQKYGKGSTRIMNCYPADANTIYCEGNAISITQWSNLATKWKSTPDDFISGSIPVFYYRSGSQLLALSQGINNTNLAKVWLDSNETSTYYTEAYSGGGVKIVKIMK